MSVRRLVLRCILCMVMAVACVVFTPATSSSADELIYPSNSTVVAEPFCPPCVKYVHHRTILKTCRGCSSCCLPPITAILPVQDPNCCTRCLNIPVCLPACCCDVPKCSASRGLLGRGRVTYTWCCGYRVVVVFRKNGEVIVHSHGRI